MTGSSPWPRAAAQRLASIVAMLAAPIAASIAAPAHAVAPCTLPAGRPGAVDDFLAAALEARARGDTAASLACLSRAYTLEPSAGLLHNIARLFEDLGRYREAAEAYRRVVRSPSIDPAMAEADNARLAALLPRLERAWVRATLAAGSEARIEGTPLTSQEERDLPPGTATVEVRTGEVLDLQRVELAAGVRRELELPAPARPTAATVVIPAGTRALTLDGRPLATPLDEVRQLRLDPGGYALSWRDGADREVRRVVQLGPGDTWSAGESEPSAALRAVPWIAGAAGLALAGGGAVLLGLAESDRRTIADAHTNDAGAIDGITLAEADRLDARAGDRTAVGVGLLVGAAVALAGATIAWVITAD